MAKDYFTFQSYVYNYNTCNTEKFQTYLGDDIINKLPNEICSSRKLYDFLRPVLNTYSKQSLFRDTFMEYYKWKLDFLI